MMMTTTKQLDEDFWANRLEVQASEVRSRVKDDASVLRWYARLGPRRRSILREVLGLDEGAADLDVREAVLKNQHWVYELMLAETATSRKREYAIVEVARSKLSRSELDRCRIQNGVDRFDRRALAWLLYLQDRENMVLVFRLDKCQRRGFARMILKSAPRRTGKPVGEFLSRGNVQKILDQYEAEHGTQKASHCAAVLHDGGNYQVFIKRDARTSFVSRGPSNYFGFKPEWIILDFAQNLGRVNVSSVSPDVPVVLANRLASEFFGEDVAFENEVLSTPAPSIGTFLDELFRDESKAMIVEFTAHATAVPGSIQISLYQKEPISVGPSILYLSRQLGGLYRKLSDIVSLKLFVFGKRVKLVFEPVGDDEEQFVVRYTEHPLNGAERCVFESMMEKDHGMRVLSMEKRHAA